MMEYAKKMSKIRSILDQNQKYQIEMPDGSLKKISGDELICTGEAFVEFLEACNNGDKKRILLAIQKINACDEKENTYGIKSTL